MATLGITQLSALVTGNPANDLQVGVYVDLVDCCRAASNALAARTNAGETGLGVDRSLADARWLENHISETSGCDSLIGHSRHLRAHA